jgi:hypothetical protein
MILRNGGIHTPTQLHGNSSEGSNVCRYHRENLKTTHQYINREMKVSISYEASVWAVIIPGMYQPSLMFQTA